MFIPDGESKKVAKGSSLTYRGLIEAILSEMHRCKQVVNPTEVANYTTEKGDKVLSKPEEVFFLTKEQTALKHSQLKRVVMTSDYGTGKTTLMKSVIKGLATAHSLRETTIPAPNRIFIVIPLSVSSMLFQSFKNFFKDFTAVEVWGLSESGIISIKLLLTVISDSSN